MIVIVQVDRDVSLIRVFTNKLKLVSNCNKRGLERLTGHYAITGNTN